MSKIEEALRRARSARNDIESPEHRARSARNDNESPEHQLQVEAEDTVVERPSRPAQSRQLVGLSAAEEIAHMREDWLLDAEQRIERRIIHSDMEDKRVSDAFRNIRTALLRRSGGKNFVVMVTSATSDGGASFVATNLAASFAFDDSKTALIIDANLREPRLNDLLHDPERQPGLTDYLSGEEAGVENIIHPVGIPRLRLMPAGSKSQSAMEYFTAPQLGVLLRELKQRYRERYIIIDTPPVTEVTDARILSELCDYALLVVPYGKVTSPQIAAAASTIGKNKLAGCVLNNESPEPIWPMGNAAQVGQV